MNNRHPAARMTPPAKLKRASSVILTENGNSDNTSWIHTHEPGEAEHQDSVSVDLVDLTATPATIANGVSVANGSSLSSHPETVSVEATKIEFNRRTLAKQLLNVVTGTPIANENALLERIGSLKALAVLSSDALSSVAYGTEASLAVLITAGTGALSHNLLLGFLVVVLLAIVAFSYRQTIFHYPNGGGSYIVAKDNLNVHYGLVAAAALLIDYVLTVSVSISAGVDALVSSFSNLSPYSVWIGLG